MGQKSFKFRVRELSYGSCEVVMTLNGIVIPYYATYVGKEPLASLIDGCYALMIDNHDDIKLCWESEPGALEIKMKRGAKDTLLLTIEDQLTRARWRELVFFDDFVSAVVSEGFRVISAFGLYGYREAWSDHTEFPLSNLLRISQMYDEKTLDEIDSYGTDIIDEMNYLQGKVTREEITEETKMDECVVDYESWQMECCGKPFAVGEKISWSGFVFKRFGNAHGFIIDFYEDHHAHATHKITGTVTMINSQFSDSDKNTKIIGYDKEWVYHRILQYADGEDCGQEPDENKKRTLWGYIVELEDVTITPLEEKTNTQ